MAKTCEWAVPSDASRTKFVLCGKPASWTCARPSLPDLPAPLCTEHATEAMAIECYLPVEPL